MNPSEAYQFILVALCVWREARGESIDAKRAVAWCIHNRASRPSWWGRSHAEVVLKPYQFSSFNQGDPNAVKFPADGDPAWQDSLAVTGEMFAGRSIDPTDGSTHYYDDSIASHPPAWAARMQPSGKFGKLNFFK